MNGTRPELDRMARFSALGCTLIALLALAGWVLGVPLLRSFGSGVVEMKANTALALLCLGTALLLGLDRSAATVRIAVAAAALVTALGLATLAEFLFGWRGGMDEFFFMDPAAADAAMPGRMSPYSAVCLVALGAALVFRHRQSTRRFTMPLAIVAVVVGAVSIAGQRWDARAVAVNSSLAFMFAGSSLLLSQSPDRQEVHWRPGALAGVEGSVLGGFALALGLLAFAVGCTYHASANVQASAQWVAHTQTVRAALANFFGDFSAAALAERDYLLSGNAERRADYDRLLSTADRQLTQLDFLTADNPVRQRSLAGLRVTMSRHRQRMAAVVAAYETGGFAGAQAATARFRELPKIDAVQGLVGEIDAREAALLVVREDSYRRDRGMMLASMIATLGIAAGIFIALFRAIHRSMLARQEAETALRSANAALERQSLQLQETNHELESFGYSVSHDLRAPLRAIEGYAAMLEEDCAERLDSSGRRYLAVIAHNAARMKALIGDLLELSQLGQRPLAKSTVDMETLVREVIEEAQPEGRSGSAAAGLPPSITVDSLPSAEVDRALMRQVWTNLVSNAIKYAGKVARPDIAVTAQHRGGENIYSIRDNGAGFNMDCYDQLFRVFQRLHPSDEFEGTGVGLAIVQRVVTLHGGRVWAEGKVGGGATFSFALPAGEDPVFH